MFSTARRDSDPFDILTPLALSSTAYIGGWRLKGGGDGRGPTIISRSVQRAGRQEACVADRAGSQTGERKTPSAKTKTPRVLSSGRICVRGCLTMSYFHERMLTIIGAESFHGPVRDGKGWFQLAMVVRHDLSARCPGGGNKPNLVEVGNLEGSM
jgi:hypothetical protein